MQLDRNDYVTTAQLRRHGYSAHAIRRAVQTGALRRAGRGRYVAPDAPTEVVTAVALRGRLTCASALRLHGVWVIDPPQAHVAIARHGHRVAPGTAAVHWRSSDVGRLAVDPVLEALDQMCGCAPQAHIVVAADSIINRRFATEDEVLSVLSRSAVGRRAARLVDGTSQSGIETLVRVALRSRRIRVRSQVRVPGVGYVDLLVGERLVIEADGREWHTGENFARDRRRDLELVRRGYLAVRLSYQDVMFEWERVERSLLELIHRGEHRRRWPVTM